MPSEDPTAVKRLRTPGSGVGTLYLAKLKAEVPHVDQTLVGEKVEPLVSTIDEFRGQNASDKEVQARLRNKVKVCSHCNKSCGYTLASCNSCGHTLEGVELSFTDNVFMGFIYGIGKGRFPYTISIRKQTEKFLCFDDPLALSPCHLNAIPTTTYISDLRFLFSNPQKGLELIDSLFEEAATAALENFWSNDAFRAKFFGNEKPPEKPEGLREIALCGMNFPPSIYQLHLQFVHPPMLPYHYALAREENHFHHGRFFPLEYLRRALQLGDKARMDVTEETDIQEIIAKVRDLGVNYDEVQVALLRRCRQLQERFAPWKEDDFECQIINDQVFSIDGAKQLVGQDPKALQADDTKALQNYGRPYNAEGRPSGSYYRYAKKPADVLSFTSSL